MMAELWNFPKIFFGGKWIKMGGGACLWDDVKYRIAGINICGEPRPLVWLFCQFTYGNTGQFWVFFCVKRPALCLRAVRPVAVP